MPISAVLDDILDRAADRVHCGGTAKVIHRGSHFNIWCVGY